MEVGEAWFLQQLAAQRNDADLRALVTDTERRLANHEAARLLRRDAAPVALPEDRGRGIARLATYVYAPFGEPAERAIAFIQDFTSAPANGYVLTHQIRVLEMGAPRRRRPARCPLAAPRRSPHADRRRAGGR